jgi:hypothetical protein
MIVYEKNNKLNINFNNSIEEVPNIRLGENDNNKTDIEIDGKSLNDSLLTTDSLVEVTSEMTPEQAAQTRQNIGAGKPLTPEQIAEGAGAWLDEHVDPDTGYVIDDTLTIQGAAADAKATGDVVGELKSAIDKFDNPIVATTNNPSYTSGIVSIVILKASAANYDDYRIRIVRKNSTWHWYMSIQGYTASTETWTNVGTVESAYDAEASYPRVETLIATNGTFAVTLDWNYVTNINLSESSLDVRLKNNIVFKPFSDALTSIDTLNANQQMFNTPFAVAVPDSIAGIVDINIYSANYAGYDKYQVTEVRHNSTWYLRINIQGYNGTSWTNIDQVEIAAASATSPQPRVEVLNSLHNRFNVTVVWSGIGSSVSLTSKTYTLKNSVANWTLINMQAATAKTMETALLPSYELSDNVKNANVIHVAADGTGDYTTIAAAYAAITDSAFNNQYEIVVHPGTYSENNLIPPAYTHTHGIYPMQTIVDSTGLYDSSNPDYSVFDQKYAPTKLSNLVIKSQTKYCVHQDVELRGVTLVNENLYCQRLSGGNPNNSACIGIGADFGGAKFIWRNCTFVDGEVGCHTNPNQDPNANQHLIYENCTFINAYVWLGVAGNTNGEYVCEIKGCKVNDGVNGLRLQCGSAITGIPVNFPWQVIGGDNNFAPTFINTSDTSITDWWQNISLTEKRYIAAAESITKGKFVAIDGTVCDGDTPSYKVAGIAVASGSSGDRVPVWAGAIPFTGTAGEYGIGSNGELSSSATIKTGYVYNNIYYPY